MPNPKPPYPPEFRAETVRLARQPGHSIRGVAHDLGIANEALRRWILHPTTRLAGAAGARRILVSAEAAELAGLDVGLEPRSLHRRARNGRSTSSSSPSLRRVHGTEFGRDARMKAAALNPPLGCRRRWRMVRW